MSSPYDLARQEGYSDEEITEYFSKQDPAFSEKYKLATQAGYDPSQVFQYYSQTKKPKESTLENVNRQAVRTGLRGAETILGAPRALGEFAESLVPEKLITKGAEKIGLGEPVKKGFEFAKKYAPYKLFPKSEQVRELNDFLFGKASKPKNEWEQKADDFTTEFVNLSLPNLGGKLRPIKSGLTALGGLAASEIVGHLGGTEKQKTWARIGTEILISIFNPKAAEKYKNQLYKQAEKKLTQGATVSSTTLENSINRLEDALKKGGIAGSDKEALQKIADVRSEMQGAQIPVDSLQKLKIKINEAKAGVYKQLEGNKPGIRSAKRNLDMVGKTVDDALKLYGKTNPEWEAFYRPANEVHGAIEQSKRARKFLERQIKKHGYHLILPALGITHFGGPAALAAPAAATVGLVTGGEVISRIMKSPTLRKHYTKLIESALKENTLATDQNLKKLEKELAKEKKD